MNSERVPGDGRFSVRSVLCLVTPRLATLFPDITIFPGNVLRDPGHTQEDGTERVPCGASPRGQQRFLQPGPPPGTILLPSCRTPVQHPANRPASNPTISPGMLTRAKEQAMGPLLQHPSDRHIGAGLLPCVTRVTPPCRQRPPPRGRGEAMKWEQTT